MIDFTVKTYKRLLEQILKSKIPVCTFSDYINKKCEKSIILRNDVDTLPENALRFAHIQHELDIKATYYFRAVPHSWNEEIIREISDLNHEIGYHYEDLVTVANGNIRASEHELVKMAIDQFCLNLQKLRKIVPVKTICMHGSPLSKWDSRLMWKYFDYHDFELTGEPYFDIDFSKVIYLTDTGRRWNGKSVSVRDNNDFINGLKSYDFENWKVKPFEFCHINEDSLLNTGSANFNNLASTFDIMRVLNSCTLPDKILMTFHPQRWTDRPVPWVKELIWQNVKNSVKYFILWNRSR